MTNPQRIESYGNATLGIRSDVFKIGNSYIVKLAEIPTGLYLPTCHFVADRKQAVEKAKFWVEWSENHGSPHKLFKHTFKVKRSRLHASTHTHN